MKVKIFNDEASFDIKIIFYDYRGAERIVYNPIDFEETYVLKEGKPVPDNFMIKIPMIDDTLKNLSEAIDKMGVKPYSDAVREGELKSTKYHLEDLRKLLKLTK